jgi:short-subunit dehydrogenase
LGRSGDLGGGAAGRRWAIVTGASGGLGREIAIELSQDGYDCILLARRSDGLDETAAAILRTSGRAAVPIVVDLTEAEAIATIEGEMDAAGIAVTDVALLVNNAGSGSFGPFKDESVESIERSVELNIRAPLRLTRWIVPHMIGSGAGVVCNVASVAAFSPGPYMATYYASKAWMLSFGESLTEELHRSGVSVVTCCPGPFESDFHEAAGIGSDAVGRVPTAAFVAKRVVRAIHRRRTVAPIGVGAHLWALLGPRLPRKWSRRIMKALQHRRAR